MKQPHTFTPSGAEKMTHELAFSLARKAVIGDIKKADFRFITERDINHRAKARAGEFVTQARVKLGLQKAEPKPEPKTVVPERMSVSQALERLRRAGK